MQLLRQCHWRFTILLQNRISVCKIHVSHSHYIDGLDLAQVSYVICTGVEGSADEAAIMWDV